MKIQDYVFKFDGDFYHPIMDDIKVSTIRANSKPVDIGDLVYGYFQSIEKACVLEIINHYSMRLKDLRGYEAQNEGYGHQDLLKHELKNIYPTLNDEDYVFIYQFKVIRNKVRQDINSFLDNMKKEG